MRNDEILSHNNETQHQNYELLIKNDFLSHTFDFLCQNNNIF